MSSGILLRVGTRQMALQAAMIDLDGTMVDTVGDLTHALNRMLGELALPNVDAEFVVRLIGGGSAHLVRAVLEHLCEGPQREARIEALLPAALQSYREHYLTVNGHHSQVFPGVVEGLQSLQARGLPMACLTNKPTPLALQLLRDKGLDGFFGHVFGGDLFERLKPDPLPLLKTCAALGSAPARTLMLGDSSNDARAARAAGCPVVLVGYGYNHGEPVRSVDADGFIDSIEELTAA